MRPVVARWLRRVAALVVAVLVVSGLTAAPATSAATTYTVTGHVYLGAYGTAVPAGEGEVQVEFTKHPLAHNPADFVATAADGSYTIPNLDYGPYFIYYRYVGTGAFGNWTASDLVYPGHTYPGSRDAYLAADAELGGIVPLGSTATPAGAGEVAVYLQQYDGGWGAESGPVLTDAAGHYSFGMKSTGVYTFRFDYIGAGDFADREWSDGPQLVGGKRAGGFNGASTPFSGNTTLHAPITISGTVSVADSSTIGGSSAASEGLVTVTYARRNFETGVLIPLGSTTTDSAGEFSIPGLVDLYGYVLSYSAPGYSPFTAEVDGSWNHGYQSFSVSRTLYRTYTVTGHVDIGGVRSALAGEVTVTFTDADGTVYDTARGSAVTDSEGNYSISGLPGRYYSVTLDYTGAEDYLDTTPALPISREGTNGVWLPTPDDLTLDFVVPPGNQISGTVYSPSGLPQANATVTLYRYATFGDPYSLSEVTNTTTAGDGTYSFTGIPDGYYGVGFFFAGYAYQAWPGWGNYYNPGAIELWGGAHESEIDAFMTLPGTISGQVSGTNISSDDFSTNRARVTLLVQDHVTGAWVFGTPGWIDGGGNYSFTGLMPGQYRVRMSYSGPAGIANSTSSTLTVGESQTVYFSHFLSPSARLIPGDLVKGPSTAAVYFVGDADGPLFPVSSMGWAADSGHSSTVKTVPQAQLNNYVVGNAPLSNVIYCPSSGAFLAAEGKLWFIDDWELAQGIGVSYLSDQACAGFAVGAESISGAVLMTSPAGATYYVGPYGEKNRVLSTATLTILAAPSVPRVYRVNDAFLASIPTGVSVLPPGAMVRGPSMRVYFVAGFDHLVPILSYDTTASMGLPSTFTTVTQADIDQATVDPDTSPLTNTVVCNGQSYFAGSGKLWPVTEAQVAGLPQTQLDASACSVLPKAAVTFAGPLLVQSAPGGAVFQIMSDGSKRQLTGRVALRPSGVVLTVAASFLASRPSGPPIAPLQLNRPVAAVVAPAAVTAEPAAPITAEQRASCYSNFVSALPISVVAPVTPIDELEARLAECLAG